MVVRLRRIAVMTAIAPWFALVASGNLGDYGSNTPFVRHVLAMDTISGHAGNHYQAVDERWIQRTVFMRVIAAETSVAALCAAGAWRIGRAWRDATAAFRRTGRMAALGLSQGVPLWLGRQDEALDD